MPAIAAPLASTITPAADPIFALIEAHRLALAAANDAPLDIADDDLDDLADVERAPRDQVHTTVLATAAGLLALVDHVVRNGDTFGFWDPRSDDPADCDAGRLLATVAAFLKTTVGA